MTKNTASIQATYVHWLTNICSLAHEHMFMDKRTYVLRMVMVVLMMMGVGRVWGQATSITSLSNISATGDYIITADIDASEFSTIESFSGTLEAAIDPTTKMPYKITGLTAPLFTTLTGTVKNLVLEGVGISGHSGNTGAIAGTASGDNARIYNVGILGGSVGGTGNTGGLVGQISDKARVINCYSYANITGGTNVGGIVGNNNATTTASSINTMVMNCMFYGDITGGTTVSPVYGGTNIANLQGGGLNTFNYYAYDKLKTKAISSGKYNSALAVEEKYLNRFEFYRLLLNSNKKLAAFYVTGNVADANQMLKWVLETADRTIDNPKPYPILKAQGKYPSIINYDVDHAPDSATVGRNHGGKLAKTLNVTISTTKTDGGQTWPTDASIKTTSLTLTRTDKDFDRFNFNYDKVQLPYYNDVGEGNYTGNRVVTGWKITDITAINDDPYTTSNYPTTGVKDYPDHNYADRKSSQKDLYTVSGRVFSQGAYFDVPYGVTSITIEPYWGQAIYVADQYYDVVYKSDFSGKQGVSQTGIQVGNNTKFNNQSVKSSITGLGSGTTVYDNAVVLVGNFHLDNVPSNGTIPFTMMSVDEDNDHEPDYSLIYHHKARLNVSPIRFDFLNVPGTSQAQRPNNASLACNVSIFKTKGWFEITNTALLYFSQFEYENLGTTDNNNNTGKVDGPLILLGGLFDQFVSTQKDAEVPGKVIYIHVGGNAWFHEFGLGTHSDGNRSTPHVPVSVTGGDYDAFYLTGTYNQDAYVREDNAECYISGGHFVEAAGACQEQIKGNVTWQIYNADIDNFFGGGINAANPITGNIKVDIMNSYVGTFCGGPKFGDMGRKGVKIASTKINFTPDKDRTVVTNATNCTFGTFFGAGYGGTAYSRKKYYDAEKYDFNSWQTKYYHSNGNGDRGKYFDGKTTDAVSSTYGKKGVGVATDFDYEFFIWSKGNTGGRFFVKFASFSLAQCNDVESNLKKCIINENFYGGGSLGKVSGTATSILEDCSVLGNVFGAGYSATLPKIKVRNGGFTSLPNFNKNSGMFEPGVPAMPTSTDTSGTTEFEWKHKDNYPANSAVGFINENGDYNIQGKYVVTTVDISKENLGSVGNANLTLLGNTTVGGNVFGGGDASAVSGDATVTLKGATQVEGDVFGGGNKGMVSGKTTVKIEKDGE